MEAFVDRPVVVFVVLFLVFLSSIAFGAFVLRRKVELPPDQRDDFKIVQSSTFTLLALLIGFCLSMAVSRYDQRKNLEEAEANAIGTEYVRADLADVHLAASIKDGLVRYTQLRIDDYLTRAPAELARIGQDTAALQSSLWELATQVAKELPNPIGAAVVTGMNDVLNSQDYSEAARINRIPLGSWALMIVIGVCGCVIQGYGASVGHHKGMLVTILPLIVALSLALISDVDSPRGGLIHIQPQNLSRLMHSFGK